MADTVQDVFSEMGERFDSDNWGSGDVTLQFNVEGDDGGNWTATILDGALSIAEGTDNDADMTMTCSDEDLLAIVNGDLNAVSAFMQGRIKIDGNMSLAMQLQSLLG